ncbi:integrase fusion protein [Mycobacterium tuberculosis]|nr:integrase fusion protein [Mycobacterium tuberculosis]
MRLSVWTVGKGRPTVARVKDLWFSEVRDPDDPTRKIRRKTKRHPDRGGSKNAKRWLACWIDPDGKEATKAFHIKDQASKYARKMEEDAARDEYIAPNAGKQQLGPLGRKWLRLRDVGAGAVIRYETVLRRYIEPTFAERQVQSVKPSEVLAWQREVGKQTGASTLETAHWILCSVFDLAVADGLRRDNPVRSPIVPTPRREPAERDPWSIERVWSVIDHHPAPYRAVPIVAAGCGMRQGEAFAVAVDDFDFDAGRVAIARQVVRIGGRIVFKLPKGGKGRTAPLSPGVARTVQAHMDEYPAVATTLPWMNEDGELAEDEVTVKLLFVWRGGPFLPTHPVKDGAARQRGRAREVRTEGENLQTSAYNEKVWKPALAAAEVIPPAERNAWGSWSYRASRRDGMHALRHYFSTTLMDAGVSLAGVMEFMGHSKKGAPVTLGVYGHVTEETYESARNAVDRSLFRLRPVHDQRASGTETEQAASQ